ncbi:MAG: cysteine desulfurase [Treponema sp.]|jgi:cysteine desulfurase|nr:cysteine desulfurase [Treponema sp.]
MYQTEKRYYFDWAATAIPWDKLPDNIHFGNPSSPHYEGMKAREALEDARKRCAIVLGVLPENIYFSSGGTESNNLVLYSFLKKRVKGRILYSATEHPSIRENCFVLERFGIPISPIAVEKDGRVSAETLSRALEKNTDTRFAAIMAVNNEIGTVTDMEKIASVIRNKGGAPIHLHSDLVQAVGKLPINIKCWDLDSASVSAHKLGGPIGIGLLYLKKPIEVLYAGDQERGIRPGTENVSGAIALAGLLEKLATPDTVKIESAKAEERWQYLINSLKKIKRCSIIPEDRETQDARFSPWILQARFKGIPGEVMLRALDAEGFAISTGSACSSASPERPVLAAMGLDEAARREGIRISQGWTTTIEDIEALLKAIEKVQSL